MLNDLSPTPLKLSVLFLSQDWIFVEKPAGMLMNWSLGVQDKVFMLQTVRNQVGRKIFPVQRLDRGTSGVVGFGLSKEGATSLQKMLQAETTRKNYIALVRGRLEGEGVIDLPIRNPKRGVQTALSLYRVLQAGEFCSLVQVEIVTGRYHQIRKHMTLIGHPIIGDFEEGKSKTNNLYRQKYGLNRPFLHAIRLDYVDQDESPQNIAAPLPEDLMRPLGIISQEFGFLDSKLVILRQPAKMSLFDDHKRKYL
jgi:tRNA pseudouridine65 synthase